MPRVKLSNAAEKEQQRLDNIRGLIEGEMIRNHINNEQLALKSLISERTLRDKRCHPEKISIQELFRITDCLGIQVIFKRREGPDE